MLRPVCLPTFCFAADAIRRCTTSSGIGEMFITFAAGICDHADLSVPGEPNVYEKDLETEVLIRLKEATSKPAQEASEVHILTQQRNRKMTQSLESKMQKEIERRNRVQDLYIDGQMNKEDYHQALDRIESRIAEYQMQLVELRRQTEMPESHKLSEEDRELILTSDHLRVEILMLFVRRIEIAEDGSVQNIDFTFSWTHM